MELRTLQKTFFVGVDGGATKCVVRVEDELGQLIGKETSGPANVRISVEEAWHSINQALKKILNPLGIIINKTDTQFHVGMGLAGCEIKEAYHSFIQQRHSFTKLIVTSDSHTACLGAHAGNEGAIIIIGTGVVGFQLEKGVCTKVGGWGFPTDDCGGGAWLGLKAIQHTLHWYDGRKKLCALVKNIYQHFSNDIDQLVFWSNHATSKAFAELAPLIINASEQGDQCAIDLMQEAALTIDEISDALIAKQMQKNNLLKCSLVGGITSFIQPYLNKKLLERLTPCVLSPDAGAILLVKQERNA